MYDTIKYEVDGHTATITMNRPDALNALSPHMITELRAAYQRVEDDDHAGRAGHGGDQAAEDDGAGLGAEVAAGLGRAGLLRLHWIRHSERCFGLFSDWLAVG